MIANTKSEFTYIEVNQKLRFKINKLAYFFIMTFLSFLFLAPFLFMLSISLTTPETTAKLTFTLLPTEFHWQNYFTVLNNPEILTYLKNSLILVIFSCIGQVFSSALVAYSFARLQAPGKNIIFAILLSTLMIPQEVTLIPQFLLFKEFGWINTLLPLIVPNFFGGAFNIFLLRQFFTRIPRDFDEAATLEGLGFFGIFLRIILPMSRPPLVAVAIFTFSWNWGWFMGPLIYVSDPDKTPLALGVQLLSAARGAGAAPEWNIVMVASFMLTLPMLLVFIWGQKYLYSLDFGVGSSAIK